MWRAGCLTTLPKIPTHRKAGPTKNYLNLLPAEARRGITLTAIYGRKPGARLPVPGINEDDYKIATQVILWEYQSQQLRSDPYSRHGNGHADANQYFSIIAGRPAEKAYNWILSQVASHSTVPSFTSTRKSEAPELELKWDTEKKIYTLTVTDTNNLNINLETVKGSGVSVSRSGNKYTFTSKNMIMDPVTFEFRKGYSGCKRYADLGKARLPDHDDRRQRPGFLLCEDQDGNLWHGKDC